MKTDVLEKIKEYVYEQRTEGKLQGNVAKALIDELCFNDKNNNVCYEYGLFNYLDKEEQIEFEEDENNKQYYIEDVKKFIKKNFNWTELYRVVLETDPYNASKYNFPKHNNKKNLLETTIKEDANKRVEKELESKTDYYMGIWSEYESNEHYELGIKNNQLYWFKEDIWHCEVENI